MSQQSSGQRVSTRLTATPLDPATDISPPLPPVEFSGLRNQELPRRARPWQDVELEPSKFRAPGVNDILNAPEEHILRSSSSSGNAVVGSTSRHETLVPPIPGAAYTTSDMRGLPEQVRRDSGPSQPVVRRLSALAPTHTEQARATLSSPARASSWLQAALRIVPPRNSTADVRLPDRVLPTSAHTTRSSFATHDVRSSQAIPLDRPSLARGAGSSSSQDTTFSMQERQAASVPFGVNASAPLGTRDLASDEEGEIGGDLKRKRNRANDYSMSGAEQQPPTRSSAVPLGTQYMTLQTDQGPMSFPVDVQAASRGADDKRRRNAGASARFRARRKEREQANSREIDDLRKTIRDLGEEVEFYRRERDYMASALQQQRPQRDRHFPRPLSPRRRHLSQQSIDADASRVGSITQETPPLYPERSSTGGQTRQRSSADFSYRGASAATSPLAPPSYREWVPGPHQDSVPPHQQQQAQLQQQHAGGRYAEGQTPQAQDSYAARELGGPYDPSPTRRSR